MRSVLVLILALVLAGAVPVAAAAAAADQPAYRLGTGDQVRITVYGQEDLSGEFEVDASGTIAMSLIGEVAIGGLTLREAEQRIVDQLKPDYLKNPRVSMQVLNYRPFYVLGEVKEPGSYDYVNDITVTEAIALAGGYTYRAAKDEVVIIRSNKADERQEHEAEADTVVLPGDTIRVPERFF